MFAIVDKNFFEITLEEYTKLKEFTAQYCGVEPIFMSPFTKATTQSSVFFEWAIPRTAVSYMAKVAATNTDIFIEEGFMVLQIASSVIFDTRKNVIL